MTASTAQELIERLEKATRPDRILSDDVLFACGWRINYSEEQIAEARSQGAEEYAGLVDNGCWYPPDTLVDWIHGFRRPDPLASIDAALTLVPEGWEWERRSDNGHMFIRCISPRYHQFEFMGARNREATGLVPGTTAIALCIAALRARLALASDGEKT